LAGRLAWHATPPPPRLPFFLAGPCIADGRARAFRYPNFASSFHEGDAQLRPLARKTSLTLGCSWGVHGCALASLTNHSVSFPFLVDEPCPASYRSFLASGSFPPSPIPPPRFFAPFPVCDGGFHGGGLTSFPQCLYGAPDGPRAVSSLAERIFPSCPRLIYPAFRRVLLQMPAPT